MNFYSDCVGWPRNDIASLTAMIEDQEPITRRTFLKHVNREELAQKERDLGYSRGVLTMAADWHVSYHRSMLRGKRCYYFRHSAIEYVFAEVTP